MTESTMEEYMMKTQEDYCPGITRPNFDKDAKFKLKGQFIKELCDHTFSGSENKDANEHTERVLEIVDLFTTPDVTQDQLMLRVFPITLTGAASRWLTNELARSITTWETLKGNVLNKYCPPSRTAKKMEEINNVHMHLVILFNKGLDVPTRQILDSKGAKLNNLGREIKKVNERVYAAQVGCELCNGAHYSKDCPLKEEGKTLEEVYYTPFGVPVPNTGRYSAAAPGFYQRDNGNPSYQERRQTMEESLNKFMVEFSKRHDENSFLIKEIRASTDAVIRNQGASIKALEIQIRQMSKEDDKMPLIELIQATIPFPGHLKENGYDEIEVLKELKKLKVNSTESATSLRRLLKEKSRIEEEIKATMKLNCSPIIEDALPPKEKYPWIFTLPCSINNMCFDKALTDLGSSVSVIPYSTFTNPDLGKLAPTKLITELADKTMKLPKWIAENVPFLSTAHAKIDVFKRKLALRIRNDKVVFKSDSPTSNIIKKVYMFGLKEQTEVELEARLMGDPEFGDFLELNDLNEPLELNDHEMEDLDPEIEDGEIIDEQKIDIVKIRYDDEIVKRIDEYPSFCDYDRKIHIKCGYNLQFYCMIGYEHVNANFFPVLSISVMSRSFYNSIMKDIIEYEKENVAGIFMNVSIFVGNFSVVTDFLIVENMDAYHDKDMGDVIVGKPFCRVAYFEARRFDGFITIYDGNNSVTYQMARSHLRFKHLLNKQCNKMRALLQVSTRDILERNSHSYQKLKGFFKGVLNLGPEYIKNEKMVEWLTRGHLSMHEMD
ncbi:ribonuclease H-like domain, reverse transcriptase, RNA-dependent DNA polymerase [Tanacetum coccineum]